MDILRRRDAAAVVRVVFPNTKLKLRDPDNTRKRMREVVEGTEWQRLHPHAFRHSVATGLDAAGLSAREIADCLGHERPSMTQDVCVSRKAVGPNVAAALGQIRPVKLAEKDGSRVD